MGAGRWEMRGTFRTPQTPPSAPGDLGGLKELTGLDLTLSGLGVCFYLAGILGLELGSGPWIGVDGCR